MVTNKSLQIIIVLVILFVSQIRLFAQEQEDIQVEFSFKKPNDLVCEIKNMTRYQINILLSKESPEGHSDLFFDMVGGKNDTIKHISYLLMKDVKNQSQVLRLDSGQVYRISYKENFPYRFIKAHIYIKYGVRSPIPKMVEHYNRSFDLTEIRNKEIETRRAVKREGQKFYPACLKHRQGGLYPRLLK